MDHHRLAVWKKAFKTRLLEVDKLLKEYAKPYDGNGGDCCDQAERQWEEIRRLSRIKELNRERERIVLSLDRVRRGIFGTCEQCGGEIPRGRLEIFPTTTVCNQCK